MIAFDSRISTASCNSVPVNHLNVLTAPLAKHQTHPDIAILPSHCGVIVKVACEHKKLLIAMDTLPQDLVDEIISYLLPSGYANNRKSYAALKKPPLPLAPLATVSRQLQAAVERLTFRQIKITSDDFEQFEAFLTPPRRYFLTNLTVTFILPTYDDAATLRVESPSERRANDECYTQALGTLFQMVKSWEVEDPKTAHCRLELAINHPESPSDRPWDADTIPWTNEFYPREMQCIHDGRYLHSYIDLLHHDTLPQLHRVKRLVMLKPKNRYGHRNVFPKVPMILASKMPNLKTLLLSLDDDEKRFPELRRKNREEAADVIRRLSLPALADVEFDFFLRRYRDERSCPPTLHSPGTPDPLSSAIYELSHGLVNLEITGAFDISVLRSLQDIRETPWPKLRNLDINLHSTTPSGDWYFRHEGDPPAHLIQVDPYPTTEYSRYHEERFSFLKEAEYSHLIPGRVFRSRVNDETLVPFIDAYADALSAIPKLRSAALSCLIEYESFGDGEPGWFSIAYFSPCASAKNYAPKMLCPKCNRGVTRQLMTSLLGWTPSEALGNKLRAIQDEFRPEPMVEKDILAVLEEYKSELEEEEED